MMFNPVCRLKDKLKFIYEWSFDLDHVKVKGGESILNKITIYMGRTQAGNDHIITECEGRKHDALWFHLANETSAHAILYTDGFIPLQDKIKAAKWIQTELTKKKDDDVMICTLADIEKTSTLGLVHVKNEVLMSDSTWTNKMK